MKEEFVMRAGDRFVAAECGCAFTVEAGPNDETMAKQAPVCCCGHSMTKQHASGSAAADEEREDSRDTLDRAPEMAD